MKKFMMMMLILPMLSGAAFADEIDDLFAGGENTEFDFERFGDEHIMEAIAHDAGIACKKGLCTFSSVDTDYHEFTINMNAGIGNNASSGFGGFNGGGTNINLNTGANAGGLTFRDRLHVGLNIQFKKGRCTRKVNVPRSLYYAINRYMYGLMNEDSTTRRSFTPADEAMILFYTTVMKQADGCK